MKHEEFHKKLSEFEKAQKNLDILKKELELEAHIHGYEYENEKLQFVPREGIDLVEVFIMGTSSYLTEGHSFIGRKVFVANTIQVEKIVELVSMDSKQAALELFKFALNADEKTKTLFRSLVSYHSIEFEEDDVISLITSDKSPFSDNEDCLKFYGEAFFKNEETYAYISAFRTTKTRYETIKNEERIQDDVLYIKKYLRDED